MYCQVPNLIRGAAPVIDVDGLCEELRRFLHEIRSGRFMAERVPEGLRQLRDIAFSGNGEPTSARNFAAIVERVGEVREQCGYGNEVPLRLITNGSLVSRPGVMAGIRTLARLGGEVWFKIDAVELADVERINGVRRSPARTLRDLKLTAAACPTWVQTCMFLWDGAPPSDDAVTRYIELLADAAGHGLRGVLLYGVARRPMLQEGEHVARMPGRQLELIAQRIRAGGLNVSVSP